MCSGIAARLYELFEISADADSEADLKALLAADASDRGADAAFRAIARDVLCHHRATCLTSLRVNHPLEPGSFMKIIRADERARLHRLLVPTAGNRRPLARPRALTGARKSRFLALQAMGSMAVSALPA
jgi:hypothetical protein